MGLGLNVEVTTQFLWKLTFQWYLISTQDFWKVRQDLTATATGFPLTYWFYPNSKLQSGSLKRQLIAQQLEFANNSPNKQTKHTNQASNQPTNQTNKTKQN